MQIIYHGHSFIEIQTQDLVIFVDPFVSNNSLCDISKEDVKKLDYILLTHGHSDHIGDTIYLSQKFKSQVISNPEVCQRLLANGVSKIHSMNIGGGHGFDFGYVYMTQAFHSSSMPDGTYGGEPAGFVIQIEGQTIYHAGDTSFFQDMSYIGARFDIDVAFLPVGDNFTMGMQDALQASKILNAKNVVPIHYNTFPVIKIDIDQFHKLFKENNITHRIAKAGEVV